MKTPHDIRQALAAFHGTKLGVNDHGRIDIDIDSSRAQGLIAQLKHTLQIKPRSDDAIPSHIPHSESTKRLVKVCKLNIVMQIVGSRGDVQPFVALGKVLKENYGHRVRLATHATFKDFVEDNGLEFFCIGGDPAVLMAFMVNNPGLMPSMDVLKSGDIGRQRDTMYEIFKGCWRSCLEPGDGMNHSEKPKDHSVRPRSVGSTKAMEQAEPFIADAIIANPPSFAGIHIAECIGVPLHMFFTMPWTPTRAFAHPVANVNSDSQDASVKNYMSYGLMELLTWQGLGDIVNKFRVKYLHLKELNLSSAPGIEHRLRIPFTYCWSPTLLPKPSDWGSEIDICGFFFLPSKTDYKPPQDLADFLAAGPPPVYIGFGSIVIKDPKAFTKLIFEAVKMAGVRALVSQGWSKFGDGELEVPKDILLLGDTPHDWLFKHVSAVVHHGGAGTMAAGIMAGKPTVIVPFFGDQPFWGNMVARAGAGPRPIPYKKLTAEKLANAIKEALEPSMLEQAETLGAKMRKEHGCEAGAESFEAKLDLEALHCDLFPDRPAVWRLKKSKVKLSALAAAILVDEERIKEKDLGLYRSVEYDTEERAWGLPLVAVGTAVTDTTIGILGGVFDYAIIAKHGYDHVKNHAQHRHEKKAREGVPNNHANDTESSNSDVDTPKISPTPRQEHSPDREKTAKESCRRHTHSFSGHLHRSVSAEAMNHPAEAVNIENSSIPNVFLEHTLGSGKGVGKILGSVIRFPLLLTLGLTQGFHRFGVLAGDPTVRPVPHVTGFHSGLKTAGSVFTRGMTDAATGLVRVPYVQAQGTSGKDKAHAIALGAAQGLFGLVQRPLEAVFALPGYSLEGIAREVQKQLAYNALTYVITTRFEIGKRELSNLDDRAATTRKALEVWQQLQNTDVRTKNYKK